jgi:predicted metal-binding membrane protein
VRPTTLSRVRPGPGAALLAGAGAAWLALVALPPAGWTDPAHHHGAAGALAAGVRPPLLVLAVFAASWLLMVAAMMLPTVVPMARMFRTVSARQERPALAMGAFLAAYFAVWLGFAALALPADLAVHALVASRPWLHDHDGLVAAGALALAGAVQFSPLTRRCLTLCRDPRAMLFGRYRRGAGGAWSLGVRHGLSCLGCCWALMLVMFAVGVSSLWWMAALTGVMVAEKTTRWGPRLVPVVGAGLLLAAFALVVGELVAVPGHAH